MPIVLEKIKRQVQMFPPESQLRLVEEIIHQLKYTVNKKALELTNLYGLGKGLWKGEDAQEYVNYLRAEDFDVK
ncbi:MAG: hypothetical protein QME07_06565 [bacterium]|nr:hypothetical protein [bacterium]